MGLPRARDSYQFLDHQIALRGTREAILTLKGERQRVVGVRKVRLEARAVVVGPSVEVHDVGVDRCGLSVTDGDYTWHLLAVDNDVRVAGGGYADVIARIVRYVVFVA